ncbi:MAG: ABC transporter permease subunit [Planctomycetota bacterium]|nr:ABC transporter permease subunit [Planctomycetota bacterium]
MTLLRQWMRDAWWIFLGYIVILEAALVAAILYWPNFRDNMPAIAKLVPFDSLQRLMESVEIAGYWPYLAVQQWFKGCSLFGLAAAAFLTSGVVARDADQKTAEFLLSRPISRRRVLLTRWVAAASLVIIPVYVTSITAIWISPAVDETLRWSDVLLSSTYMSLFLLMLVTFTAMISAMSNHQLKAGIILIGVILLNFAFYLIQEIDAISLFKTIDVWVFMDIQAGNLPWITAGCFAGATIIMLLIALGVYSRRDF